MKRILQSLRQASFIIISSSAAMAQTGGIQRGASALTSLTGDLQSYIDPVTTVVYVVAAVIGLVGALRVYVNWQNGKENVMANATGWLGACLFLLIANTVLRAMFVA
ncbi:putative plasmid transfer protein (plasmid) [Runella slithyformis DSM 19594]|uniref:Plasmid transfer protein n=2 Tax=Runella TaxID=105 RepID=A0A7U4E8Y2_RUNSL|nr:putative plasmid transfer protein [Runella slithyformis DSM 19594]